MKKRLLKGYPNISCRSAPVFFTIAMMLLASFTNSGGAQVGGQSHQPFDLIADLRDENNIITNPKWAWQLANAGVPDPDKLCFTNGKFGGCTSHQVSYNEPSLTHKVPCSIGSKYSTSGHINWGPAVYTGEIYWEGHEWVDGDNNFALVTAEQAGLTVGNTGSLHLEFDGSETINNFNTPWWKQFRQAVDDGDINVRRLVNGRRAIAIGMMGLDCVHTCYTELHPVWALAINVESKLSDDKRTMEEVWAIFVRNWGNEGFCGKDQVYLDLNRVSLILPWFLDKKSGVTASSFNIGDRTKFLSNMSSANGPDVSMGSNRGLLVSFNLPNPEAKGRVHGELHLQWQLNQVASAGVETSSLTASGSQVRTSEAEKGDVENQIARALGEHKLRELARQRDRNQTDNVSLKPSLRVERASRLSPLIFTPGGAAVSTSSTSAPVSPGVRVEFDAEKEERDKRLLEALPPSMRQ